MCPISETNMDDKTTMEKDEKSSSHSVLTKSQNRLFVISQFSKEVSEFSSQYGSESSISYTACNLAGKSNIYPSYGDYTQACVFRTYGPWWNLAPSGRYQFKRKPPNFISQDYIELTFSFAVYPCKLEMWETYNWGAVVRILACDTSGTDVDSGRVRWQVLWEGDSQTCTRRMSRIFSPELKATNFKTNIIRLEFCHDKCEYYTELDCVTLYGSTAYSPYIMEAVRKSDYEDLTHGVDNDTMVSIKTQIINERLRSLCNLHQGGKIKDIPDQLNNKEVNKLSAELEKKCAIDGEDTEDLTDNMNGFFDDLPEEVLQLILSYLDIPSLCTASRTCRLLHQHCYDSLQYRELDLQPHWTQVNDHALRSLHSRCKYLQRLNLSWCGGNKGSITCSTFTKFLEECGQELSSLYLSSCKFVNTSVLSAIAKYCPKLTELDLATCVDIDSFALHSLCSLKNLRRLNLYRTLVNKESVLAVIKVSKHLQHLNLGSCSRIDNFDEVARALATNCKDLRSLDVWRSKNISHEGIMALSCSCPNLEELDLGWCSELKSTTGCFTALVQSCPNMKKLYLTANRTVCDDDLLAIAKFCPKLEQLDILGTRQVTLEAAYRVLSSCPNLIMFDVSFCAYIDSESVKTWREEFPHCDVKKSYQD